MLDTGLIENKDELLKRLLCYGLFPERIPPVFSSVGFGSYCYNKIKNDQFNHNEKITYKHIIYPLTQDNKVRMLGVPNCFAYAHLCNLFYNNWDTLKQFFNKNWANHYNPNMIRMQKQKKRLFSLDNYLYYWGTENARLINITKTTPNEIDYKLSLIAGNKYCIHLDISKFYNSIYAHAISWALITKRKSKELYRNKQKEKAFIKNEYNYKCFENYVIQMQDKESFGIPIGPDTSYIIADILLSPIDNILFSKGFKFIRYIDDYYFCATNESNLQNFANELRKQLYIYKLNINDEKTEITKFPIPLKPEWVNELDNYSLPDAKDSKFFDKLIYFIDKSVVHSATYGAKTIKYAMKYITNKYRKDDLSPYIKRLFMYYMHLIFIHPYLIDCLDRLLGCCHNVQEINNISSHINTLLGKVIKENNYDTIAWIIYICDKYKIDLNIPLLIKKNFVVKDCFCLVCLLYYLKNRGELDKYKQIYYRFYYNEIKLRSDDEFWLLEYELFKEDIISNLNRLPKNIDAKIQSKYDEKQKNYQEMKKANISFVTM